MAESAEELSWLDYFSGGVPTGEYFRMTLEDLRKLVDLGVCPSNAFLC
jgi:hypothetical protein